MVNRGIIPSYRQVVLPRCDQERVAAVPPKQQPVNAGHALVVVAAKGQLCEGEIKAKISKDPDRDARFGAMAFREVGRQINFTRVSSRGALLDPRGCHWFQRGVIRLRQGRGLSWKGDQKYPGGDYDSHSPTLVQRPGAKLRSTPSLKSA